MNGAIAAKIAAGDGGLSKPPAEKNPEAGPKGGLEREILTRHAQIGFREHSARDPDGDRSRSSAAALTSALSVAHKGRFKTRSDR